MSARERSELDATRRSFLIGAAGAGGAGLAGLGPAAAVAEPDKSVAPFYGANQAGIVTPQQNFAYFAAFDLLAEKREDVAALLKTWTDAAAKLTAGEPVPSQPDGDYAATQADPNEMMGIGPARLTLTFGFGPGLFDRNGQDVYGLAKRRPEAFVDLPAFAGDQFQPARTGGDLIVQACADNPQVAFHAVRTLNRVGSAAVRIRWVQNGFVSDYGHDQTARNLLGFKDGTGNPSTADPSEMDKVVWVGGEGPDWMRGGSYMVVRRSRMALEHWERMKIAFQEQTFGRHKRSGAPIGKTDEFDPIDLAATDADGNPLVPQNSHVGIAHGEAVSGNRILRRSYSYDEGANMTAERWPPWRQGMEFDAGLIFVGYQRDTRKSFIPIFGRMSRFDMMNQFVTNTGGGHFACPGGVAEGDWIGRALFEA